MSSDEAEALPASNLRIRAGGRSKRQRVFVAMMTRTVTPSRWTSAGAIVCCWCAMHQPSKPKACCPTCAAGWFPNPSCSQHSCFVQARPQIQTCRGAEARCRTELQHIKQAQLCAAVRSWTCGSAIALQPRCCAAAHCTQRRSAGNAVQRARCRHDAGGARAGAGSGRSWSGPCSRIRPPGCRCPSSRAYLVYKAYEVPITCGLSCAKAHEVKRALECLTQDERYLMSASSRPSSKRQRSSFKTKREALLKGATSRGIRFEVRSNVRMSAS